MPVTIRLLDPPLHEFLPRRRRRSCPPRRPTGPQPGGGRRARSQPIARPTRCSGHRGCRLGIAFPAITRMQARAILGAALTCAAEGVHVEPEIMIPLVADPEELRRQRELVVADGRRGLRGAGATPPLPSRHDDRASARRPPRRPDRRPCRLLQLRHERPDPNDLRPQPRRRRPIPTPLHRTGDFRRRSVPGARPRRRRAARRHGHPLGRQTRPGLVVGICGEHGGEPSSIAFATRLGWTTSVARHSGCRSRASPRRTRRSTRSSVMSEGAATDELDRPLAGSELGVLLVQRPVVGLAASRPLLGHCELLPPQRRMRARDDVPFTRRGGATAISIGSVR